MSGFLFFWLTWAGWIFVTFLLNRTNPYRFRIAFWLLVIIITSVYQITIFEMNFSIASIILFVLSLTAFIHFSLLELLYVTIRILILAIASSTSLFVSLYDPVWFIIEQPYMNSITIAFLSIVLFNKYRERIFGTTIGMCLSDGISYITLNKLYIEYTIGSLTVLDSCALTCFIISIWSGMEFLQSYYSQKQGQPKKGETVQK